MTQVTLTNLAKRYPGAAAPAVDHLNLEFASGGLHALLGPSGCGKTTTMKMIAGLLQPSHGDITFDGASVLHTPAERRGAVMVFQNYLLFPYRSVGDNVGFGLKMRGVDRATIRRRVAEMLELVRLPGVEERRPKQLSGGQQQRVALARALIVQPNVLLLDEPLSNLDAHLRDEMRDLIRTIQQQMGITTIFVTHDQEEAVVLADRIALMFDGVLHQVDAPQHFYDCPVSARVARFFGGANFISGHMQNGQFESRFGHFCVQSGAVMNGPALLTIRPEAIQLCHAESSAHQQNMLTGRVVSHLYTGVNARFKIQVDALTLTAVADPHAVNTLRDGDAVTLYLAPERLWTVPVEADSL
ncbi:MAG: ABC transporter ATP-binding protein [Caldilineaceae bacterium]